MAHLSFHKNWHPLAGEVEAIIDGCEYRGQDSKYCSAKIVDHMISHIGTITSTTETASEGKNVDTEKIVFFKNWNFYMGSCPSCSHSECDTRYNYCENCGQKLIWPTPQTQDKGE